MLLLVGDCCRRYMDGLVLSQHSTITRESPEAVVEFARKYIYFFSPQQPNDQSISSKQIQCWERLWFKSLLPPSGTKILR